MSAPLTVFDVAGGPEGLLEASWTARGRPMGAREWRIEILATTVFAGLAALLVALTPGSLEVDAGVALLVAAYAVATRVQFPIARAAAVPSQIFLVPLFFAAPAATVPALVAAGLLLGTLMVAAAGRTRLDRLACVGGDAFHAIGPACILLLLAGGTAAGAAPWVLGLALVAQFALDLVSGVTREYLISGVKPRIQTAAQLQIWAADLALAPVGLLAATAPVGGPVAAVALLPLIGFLAYGARDRRARIATAHDRLQALESERERLRLAVRRVGDAFAANLDTDGILGVVRRTLTDALQADTARSRFRDADVIETGDDFSIALRRAEDEALSHGCLMAVQVAGIHGIACPLHGLGAVLSVARRGRPYAREERSLLAYLSRQADIAGSNAMRHQFVQHQAQTDELTALANHRRFQEVLDARMAGRRGQADGLALMLVDLDDFKLVNDRHGHLAGDEVLREVGRCLRESCRSTDHPARYGGEEFAVVLEEMDQAQALALAERVRQAIARSVVSAPDGGPLTVTASIGLSWTAREGASRQELIAAADAALYEAKRQGKNRVAWADLDAGSAAQDSGVAADDVAGAAAVARAF